MMRVMVTRQFVATGFLGGLVIVLPAAAADKSGYGLGNPTPVALLRDLNSDRPDATEGPYTVDAGHVQLEMDLLNNTSSRSAGGRTTDWGVAPFNLRLGVRDNFELGLFVTPFVEEIDHPAGGASETHSGIGDLTIRAKVNFWGNEGGGTALGLIADLKLPTAAAHLGDGAGGGEVLLPVSFELGAGWDLGAMTGLENVKVDSGGRRFGWINSASLGHAITEKVAGYVELATETGVGSPVTTLDTGLTLKISANTQFDVGAQFGVSQAAADVLAFTGLTHRF
jgi:hypothetical protein